MISLLFSATGLLMVIIPLMLNLWFKYQLYQNSILVSNGSIPRAEILYKATVQAGYIHDRWDNYIIRKYKNESIVLGSILIVLGFIHSFDYQPVYFILSLYTIWGGLLWIFLEYLSINYCLKNLCLKKYQLLIVATFAPFAIVGIEMIMIIVLIKTGLASGYYCEQIDSWLTF